MDREIAKGVHVNEDGMHGTVRARGMGLADHCHRCRVPAHKKSAFKHKAPASSLLDVSRARQ